MCSQCSLFIVIFPLSIHRHTHCDILHFFLHFHSSALRIFSFWLKTSFSVYFSAVMNSQFLFSEKGFSNFTFTFFCNFSCSTKYLQKNIGILNIHTSEFLRTDKSCSSQWELHTELPHSGRIFLLPVVFWTVSVHKDYKIKWQDYLVPSIIIG